MARHPARSLQAKYERTLRIAVDPVLARNGAWYEFFPRSAPNDGVTHETFRGCELRLPERVHQSVHRRRPDGAIKQEHPEALFLSDAFARPVRSERDFEYFL